MTSARSLPAILSALLLAAAFYTLCFTARMLYRAYCPVIYWDQWHYVTVAMRSGAWPSWSRLWAQVDESRLFTGSLAGFLDLRFFGGRNLSLQWELILIPTCLAALLICIARRQGRLRGPALASAAAFTAFCAFAPVQVDDFFWYFEVGFVLTGLAAVVSFAALTLHASSTRWISAPLLVSLAAAFVAECSRFDGLLVWPILLLLACALRLPRKTCALIAAAATLAVAAYFWNFHPSHQQSAQVRQALHQPLALLSYIDLYFAATWNTLLPPHSAPSVAARILAACALLIALLSFRSWRDRFRTFLAAILLFAISAACITSAGRLTFGVAQAAASRYQCVALLFWSALGALLVHWAAARTPRYLAAVQALLLLLMFSAVPRFPAFQRIAEGRRDRLNAAYLALIRDPNDAAAAVALNPTARLMPPWLEYLRRNRLGPSPSGLASRFPVIPDSTSYTPVPAARCTGWIDGFEPGVHPPGTAVLTGWAWDRLAAAPPLKIWIATPAGLAAGTGEMRIPREDVPGVVPEVIDINNGWEGAVAVPPATRLRAYAILNDGRSACPLPNELVMP